MDKLIVISGSDGSGKTTSALLLASYLSRRSETSIHWFRGSHMHVSLLYRLFRKLGILRGEDNPYYGVSIPRKARFPFSLLEFSGILPLFLARFFKRLVSDYLVCDRGALDFAIWVSATLNYPEYLRSLLGKFSLSLASREKPILLTAPPDILMARSKTPRAFLYREHVLYEILGKYFSRCVIDTSELSPIEVVARVLKCVGN
ncbi:MAG: hypothetical protein C0179_05480 [Fervidicoccus sp.]|nr:MAG: hypothetical protein C0179_05480 [Fervidicoccus sp.]